MPTKKPHEMPQIVKGNAGSFGITGNFPCPICMRVFHRKTDMGAHKRWKHPDSKKTSDMTAEIVPKVPDVVIPTPQSIMPPQSPPTGPQPSAPATPDDSYMKALEAIANTQQAFAQKLAQIDAQLNQPRPQAQPNAAQQQKVAEDGNNFQALANTGMGLLFEIIKERKARNLAPDPFSQLGQMAFANFLNTFSRDYGKATGKKLGSNTKQEEDDEYLSKRQFAGWMKGYIEGQTKTKIPDPEPAETEIEQVIVDERGNTHE